MTSGQTHPEIIQFMFERLKDAGMLPVIARKESTGLIVNRLWAAIKREVMMILSEGVSEPKEIDTLFIRMFQGNPQGPCGMMDAIGLDTVALIEENYIEERRLDSAPTVDWLRTTYIDQGKLGAKSGKGGLYPPGETTKPAQAAAGHHDNLAAPMLYVLDVGLGATFEASKGFTGGNVMTLNADGDNLKALIEGLTTPDGIDVSIPAGRIFWTSMGIPGKPDGCVLSAKLDGSDIQTVIPKGATNIPKQLVIDHTNSKIYFCDREGQSVHRSNFNGTYHEILIQTGDWQKDGFSDGTKWCVGIAIDPPPNKLYWSQKGASKAGEGRIFRAGIDIPPGQTASSRSDIELLFNHLLEPIDLELDPENQVLYWTDRGEYPLGNTLSSADASAGADGTVVTLARHFHEAIGMRIDTVNRHIYVADLGGAVYRFNMDGMDRRRIVDTDKCFTGIAIAYLNH